jgi:predicted phosphate transport protein (TIGR00153 family)
MSLKLWFRDRNSANIMEGAATHLRKVLETLVEFERGFNIFVKEKNPQLAFEIFRRVDDLEREADGIRRDLLIQISKSELSPQIREDLTHLVKRIDKIANMVNGASRRIMGMPSENLLVLGDFVFDKMLESMNNAIQAAKVLVIIWKRFRDAEMEEILNLCHKIQVLEHKCDIIQSEIYEELNKMKDPPFNYFVAIQISNLVDMIESISDKVEDVGDYIEVLKTAKK